MITLRLASFTSEEIEDLIGRLEVINPENTIRCGGTTCESCRVKHICYSISHAIEYANAYLEGRYDQ